MGLIADIAALTRPPTDAALTTGTPHRNLGLLIALVGWGAGALGLLISIATAAALAQGGARETAETLAALSFGIATAALGTGKTGIAFGLWGIVRRIWVRFASLKTALPSLVTVNVGGLTVSPPAESAFGRVTTAPYAPAPLLIHRMARAMWAPMLLMGVMALYLGLVLAAIQSQSVGSDPALARALRAWVPGLQFLAEGFILSAIAFLLGTILGALRAGGGEVQESLGVTVKTLAMPATAKVFVLLMMAGLMVEVVQFLAYAYVATIPDDQTFATYLAWLGPFREFGLGLLLSSIVFALATIARVVEFQLTRVRELITTGR